jgi:predicted nucleotidyltransferase
MNVGIIAEYNPFHKGHLLHLVNTKALTQADNVIAIISGSFVQRGEPAAWDKFTRTKAALMSGVDMVLELPVAYATGSADVFAYGAVDSLNKSGIIDYLSFGTESGDIALFKDAAKLLTNETDEFRLALKKALDTGVSYPAARQTALSEVLHRDMSFLSSPNNILALEYLKALLLLGSSIQPITVKREVNGYNTQNMTGEISSATAIRHSLVSGEWDIALSAVPPCCHDMLRTTLRGNLPTIDSYTEVLKYILRTKSPDELADINDISEGLENRILACTDFKSITELADRVKSKRYAHSKVRRAILHILLNIKKADADTKNGVNYIRVLGFKRDKAHLVSELTKKASVPVITNVKNAPVGLLDNDIFATDMYYMPLTGEINKDLTEPMVMI